MKIIPSEQRQREDGFEKIAIVGTFFSNLNAAFDDWHAKEKLMGKGKFGIMEYPNGFIVIALKQLQ